MNYPYVFLDLETTGNDPDKDMIIEVAAVKVDQTGNREIFHCLVNPDTKISEFITGLTGITNKMVEDAPSFCEISAELKAFLADTICVAHNAQFDFSFLSRIMGVVPCVAVVDSLTLARIIFPNLGSYSLRYLSNYFGLSNEPSHRALDDAVALEELYFILLQQVKKMSLSALKEVCSFFPGDKDGLSIILQYALLERIKNCSFIEENHISMAEKRDDGNPALELLWDIGFLERLFSPEGEIGVRLTDYQIRPQQLEMLRAVFKAFNQERHLLVEAGTGTGKSLAYLIPVIAWAVNHQEKVVVATHTITLQEQLYQSEIRFLQDLGINFNAVVLKGRNNYLCLRKYAKIKEQQQNLSENDRILIARIGAWLVIEGLGDKDKINLRGWEREFFNQLSSNSETCLGLKCPYKGDCFYQKARQAALSADIIIINHSLLLSDLRLGESILPKYQHLVIDEAHHLEEESTRQFGEEFSLRELRKSVSQLKNKSDHILKGNMLTLLDKDLAGVTHLKKVQTMSGDILISLGEMLDSLAKSKMTDTIRITPEIRGKKWWEDLSLLFDNVLVKLKTILEVLQLFIEQQSEVTIVGEEPLQEYRAIFQQLQESYHVITRFFSDIDEEMIYWLENEAHYQDLRLHISPLLVAAYLQELLFLEKKSVVLTSATLCVDESFVFIKEQLGIPSDLLDTLRIGSPFFYEEQALFLVDNSLPEPSYKNAEIYTLALKEALYKIIAVTGGSTLVLFTAHKQLRDMYNALNMDLTQIGLELFADNINGNRNTLIQEMKSNSKAVVFGANTFWEGIDLPRENLTSVIIVKLPFWPPNLPIVEARVNALQREGMDGFNYYSVPQAVLKFRQGYGRLIRTINDRGIVILLDKRIINKSYGKVFIKSLPHQAVISGCTAEIINKIKGWL